MKDLKEWHKKQIEDIKLKLGINETLELYKACGVSRATVSLWTSNKNTSKEYLTRKYKDMIVNYYANLSPVELIERIEQEKSKELLRELEEVKRVNSRLLEELGREEHY